MNQINFIFDFDGTLVDSFQAVTKKFNQLASEFNFRQVNEDELPHLRHLTSRDFIKYLNIPLYKIPAVLIRARALIRNEIETLPTFTHLRESLKKIQDLNINLGILTSNSLENVTRWLKSHDMENFFNFIHIESSFFGKKRVLQKIIKTYRMNKSQTFYIGDETRDIEAAKECSIHAVAVTWGFNSEEILLQHTPHFIARKPEDLLAVFETKN